MDKEQQKAMIVFESRRKMTERMDLRGN